MWCITGHTDMEFVGGIDGFSVVFSPEFVSATFTREEFIRGMTCSAPNLQFLERHKQNYTHSDFHTSPFFLHVLRSMYQNHELS